MEEAHANEINWQLPEILEKIFSNFSVKSLCRAATVNKLWNEMAMYELRKRSAIGRPQVIVMPASNVFDVMDITKPAVTLVFVSNLHMNKYKLMKQSNSFPNVMFVTTGILMMDEKEIPSSHMSFYPSEFSFDQEVGISLLIPQREDLEIRTTNNKHLSGQTLNAHDDTLRQTLINNILPKDSKLKATFIIFGMAVGRAARFFELLKKRMKEREQEYVIWGTYCMPKKQKMIAMSFTGLCIESSSIVINLDNRYNLDQRLQDFRDKLQLKRRSIGLLCSQELWDEDLVPEEITRAVKKIFPETTLIGLFEEYHFCYGFKSKNDDPEQELQHHTHSLSLMILTYD